MGFPRLRVTGSTVPFPSFVCGCSSERVHSGAAHREPNRAWPRDGVLELDPSEVGPPSGLGGASVTSIPDQLWSPILPLVPVVCLCPALVFSCAQVRSSSSVKDKRLGQALQYSGGALTLHREYSELWRLLKPSGYLLL